MRQWASTGGFSRSQVEANEPNCSSFFLKNIRLACCSQRNSLKGSVALPFSSILCSLSLQRGGLPVGPLPQSVWKISLASN